MQQSTDNGHISRWNFNGVTVAVKQPVTTASRYHLL